MKCAPAWLKSWAAWVFEGRAEWSCRTEAGVKLVVTEAARRFSVRVDLDDPQTKEILRRRLEVYAQYEILDGRLVRKEGLR